MGKYIHLTCWVEKDKIVFEQEKYNGEIIKHKGGNEVVLIYPCDGLYSKCVNKTLFKNPTNTGNPYAGQSSIWCTHKTLKEAKKKCIRQLHSQIPMLKKYAVQKEREAKSFVKTVERCEIVIKKNIK